MLVAGFTLRGNAADAVPAKFMVLDDNIAYLHIDQFSQNLASQLAAQDALAVTNKSKFVGIILDLRFASGETDGLDPMTKFLGGENLPMAILVNDQTRGAAAALATQLRAANAGIVIGATNPVVPPDITVTVGLNDERKFLANPYGPAATNGIDANLMTNDYVPFVDHTSEADLVRQKIKDGDQDEDTMPAARSVPPAPVVRDPVLARAEDFLKALAFLRPVRA